MTTPTRRPPGEGTGRCWIGAALATVLLAAGCREPPAPSCTSGAPIEVDLEAWQAAVVGAVRSAAPGAELDRLLGQLALPPLPAGAGPAEDAAIRLTGPTEFQLFPVRRGGEASDQLLAVRFGAAHGAEFLRAQLLRPLAGRDHLYCPLGDDLSHDREEFAEPCLEPHDGPARALVAEPLVGPDRHAIVARDAGGWCGSGTRRGDRLTTSWWGVEEDRLVRYLEVVTHEAWYESPAPPGELRHAEVGLSQGWPRTITVSETVECPDGEGPAGAGCRALTRVTRYRYADGQYAAVAERQSLATPRQAEEETTP